MQHAPYTQWCHKSGLGEAQEGHHGLGEGHHDHGGDREALARVLSLARALAHIVVSLGGRGQAERIAARVGQFLGKFLVQN